MSDRQTAVDIAIVIPYFQRTPGLLRQCVASILEQSVDRSYRVIVVDDASPIPARDELADLSEAARERVEIVEQANAGPGAARNAGLDRVPADTPYVTFLDSDDKWTANFLGDALAALDGGYDLFFGNSERLGQSVSRFEWHDEAHLNINLDQHVLIDDERQLYEFRGDFFNLLVRRSNIIGPTTMAYRFDRFPAVRFDTTLYNGQDRLFKLSLGQHLGSVAMSPKIYAYEGEGINIFDKATWGSAASLRLLGSYIQLSKRILERIDLNREQRSFVKQQLSDARRSFAEGLAHMLRHRLGVDWSRVRTTFAQDPLTALLLVPNILGAVFGRFIGR